MVRGEREKGEEGESERRKGSGARLSCLCELCFVWCASLVCGVRVRVEGSGLGLGINV
jgi:hypothetical protein